MTDVMIVVTRGGVPVALFEDDEAFRAWVREMPGPRTLERTDVEVTRSENTSTRSIFERAWDTLVRRNNNEGETDAE